MFYKLLLILSGCCTSLLVWGQLNTPLDLMGNHEFGWSIVRMPDSTYVMASNSVCEFPQGDLGCIELVNITEQGELIWHRTFSAFPNSFDDGGVGSLILTKEGDLIIGGDIYHPDHEYDAMLFKVSSQGDSLWMHHYGSIYRDLGRSVCQTPDGGYAIVGITSFGAGSGDLYLLKTDANGILEWQRTFGGTAYDLGASIAVDRDGGFILGGSTNSFGNGGQDGWIIKTDSLGQEVWSRTYGTTGEDGLGLVSPSILGGYLGRGNLDTTINAGDEIYPRYLARFDEQGNTLQAFFFNAKEHIRVFSYQELPDGSILVVGTNDNYFYDIYDAATLGWITKLSPTGEVLWERTYYPPYQSPAFYLTHAAPTPDGGFMVTGNTGRFFPRPDGGYGGNSDFWVMKIDSLGCLLPGCQDFPTNCHSFADTMQITTAANTVLVCHQDTLQVGTKHPPIVNSGDTLLYTLHQAPGTQIRFPKMRSTDGRFTFDPDSLEYLNRYYASAFVAPVDYQGEVIIRHSCTSVAKGTHTIFLPPIDLHAQTICDTTTGEARVQIQLTGGAPSYNADQYHYQLTASNGSVTALVLTDTLLIPAVADQDTLRFTVSDEVGCIQELSYVVACPRVTSVATIARPPQPLLSISPNPIQQQAMLRISTPSSSSNLSHTIQVHDVTGKIVQQYTLAPQQQQVLLDRGDLPDGMYFCTLHQAGNLLDQVKILLIK